MVRTMRSSSRLIRRCSSSRRRSNISSSSRPSHAGQHFNRRNLSSTSPNSGSFAAVRANVLCGMFSETFSEECLSSGGWKACSEDAPPSFGLSAWTCDGGRRTSSAWRSLSNGPFQGAERQPHRWSVKKASRFLRKWDVSGRFAQRSLFLYLGALD